LLVNRFLEDQLVSRPVCYAEHSTSKVNDYFDDVMFSQLLCVL